MLTTTDSARTLMGRARDASGPIGQLSDPQRQRALHAMADAIASATENILAANDADLERGKREGLSVALQDRLRLDAVRVAALAAAVREIAELPDPLGRILDERILPNGISLKKITVPFGVVGAIYEARPNVTVDIAALAIRSGNAVVLRGGSAAERSNRELVQAMRAALDACGHDPEAIQSLDEFGREGATELMRARGLIDVLIPRGSAHLIETVVTESLVPVIETGSGVVHILIDESALTEAAHQIVMNAKVQRPSVCNAVETVLVHRGAAARIVPELVADLQSQGVAVHGDAEITALADGVIAATEDDWAREYLSLDLAMRVVSDLDEALAHIRQYSTKHTECIVSADPAHIDRFLAEVDAAVVMANASTRFTDGGEFGFGAEVGISTQKLHARGPMGVNELTSTKWLGRGDGQVRA